MGKGRQTYRWERNHRRRLRDVDFDVAICQETTGSTSSCQKPNESGIQSTSTACTVIAGGGLTISRRAVEHDLRDWRRPIHGPRSSLQARQRTTRRERTIRVRGPRVDVTGWDAVWWHDPSHRSIRRRCPRKHAIRRRCPRKHGRPSSWHHWRGTGHRVHGWEHRSRHWGGSPLPATSSFRVNPNCSCVLPARCDQPGSTSVSASRK